MADAALKSVAARVDLARELIQTGRASQAERLLTRLLAILPEPDQHNHTSARQGRLKGGM